MRKKQLLYIIPLSVILLFIVGVFSIRKVEQPHPKPEKAKSEEKKAGYDKPEGYYQYFQHISSTPGQRKSGYPYNYRYNELKKALRKQPALKRAGEKFNWIQRGPGNVGGRTREVIIDPDDAEHKTWYAAAVSGGVWKTTDGGNNWNELTDELPNLATNCIAMAPSNHNTLYVGTGEGYGGFGMVTGNGILKSTDRGQSWTILGASLDTANQNFRWVNKIVVHPEDENQVIVATNSGIYKTLDGGLNWDTVYFSGHMVQDLTLNPLDGNTVYAGVNRLGILRSYDFGDTWQNAYNGIGTGYRYSVSVSGVDTSYVFTGVEAPKQETHVYISTDAAENWRKMNDVDFSFIHFFGSQGWFNNVVKAHPFSRNEVFIGGVYLGKLQFQSGIGISEPGVIRVDTVNTGSFLSFVNFGGEYLDGSLATGLAEDAEVEEDDFSSVEIRFGAGVSQLAHRFTVPDGEGAGVPPEDYSYQDYVEVPFQVFDVESGEQLMVSFRDQDKNGVFNLIEREYDDDISGREYIFIHALDYTETPHADIALSAGHYYKMTYFVWPTLPDDAEWNPSDLPEANITILYGNLNLQNATTTVLADDNRNSDLHVDHHDIEFAIVNESTEEFMIVEANDGGLGISEDGGLSWKQLKNNYPTTQFYGVAKKPGAHEYIGGMQDNGTWQSTPGEVAGSQTEYLDRVAGDGFEALWHPEQPHRILASTYYNGIRLSTDGGENWTSVTDGIRGDGPFITRLSHSPENPDLVFAVGDRGIYRHTNFCVGRYPWESIDLGDSWAVNNEVTSSHNVEVSLADPSIVWAGGGMFRDPDLNIFVSEDYGRTFDTVALYTERDEMGYISAIATHPAEPETAYLLFSIDHKPKLLRTTDLGQSWEDLSGFGIDSTSSNGFPDVMVFSLMVFPYDTEKIWVGTEIGIFESMDNGETWHYANSGLPAVSIWEMFMQDNSIVVATHGRGIWSAPDVPGKVDANHEVTFDFSLYPNPATNRLNLKLSSEPGKEYTIRIYSLNGQVMYEKVFSGNSLSVPVSIDLNDIPAGLYVASVESDSGRSSKRLTILGNR